MKTVYDYIASEIMDVIERERRINKDDLVLAAEIGMRKHGAAVEQAAKDERKALVTDALSSAQGIKQWYDARLQEMISDQMRHKANAPASTSTSWTGSPSVHSHSFTIDGNDPATHAHTVVVGVDPAKRIDSASCYGVLVSSGAADWMKA